MFLSLKKHYKIMHATIRCIFRPNENIKCMIQAKQAVKCFCTRFNPAIVVAAVAHLYLCGNLYANEQPRSPSEIIQSTDQNLTGNSVDHLSSPFDLLDEREDGKHYIHVLDIGDKALLARIHLIRAARKSIHIQTFIWTNDESGRYVVYELLQAAKRGVKINSRVEQIT